MKLTLASIQEADSQVRDLASYVSDPKLRDSWTSYLKDVLAGRRFGGDCDDWAQTTLELLITKGAAKKRLYRAIVSSTGGETADHMIGLVELDDGTWWCVGDTFGEPVKVKGDRVRGHRILQTSRVGEMRGANPLWRFWRRPQLRRETNTEAAGMKTSPRGVLLIKTHEELRTRTYDDKQPWKVLKAGDAYKGVLTIGYGHTGPDVKLGQVISEQEAVRLLVRDLAGAEAAVRKGVLVPITQDQFDALVSFTFNVGAAAFLSSTLLKKINTKRPASEIQAQFRRWNKDDGKVVRGLVARRDDEADLWVGKPVKVDAASSRGTITTNVQPTGLVEEDEKPTKSKDVWALGGLLTASVASAMLEAVREFKDMLYEVDIPVVGSLVGAVIAGLSAYLLYTRLKQIMVEAKR